MIGRLFLNRLILSSLFSCFFAGVAFSQVPDYTRMAVDYANFAEAEKQFNKSEAVASKRKALKKHPAFQLSSRQIVPFGSTAGGHVSSSWLLVEVWNGGPMVDSIIAVATRSADPMGTSWSVKLKRLRDR